MTPVPMCVVGVGHLGKEHARILSTLPGVELLGVVDPRPAQAEIVAQRCGTRAYADHRPLLHQVRAAVIAVPTVHHHAVAHEFLDHGVPLLVEKPLASTLPEADDLVALAGRKGVPLQVGHIERFNPAFEELQRCPLRPRYICCERRGGFTGRSTDVGVVLDLMIHDLDLVLTLVRSPVRAVEALGLAVLGGHEDLVQARITFANGCVADLTACRVSPTVARSMHIWGAEGYARIDFGRKHLTLVQPGEELRRGGIDVRRLDAAALAGLKTELFSRHLQTQERDCNRGDQLTEELEDFLVCVRTGRAPRVEGTAARDALALAQRILDSLEQHSWDGTSAGPTGPREWPGWRGPLFGPPLREAA
jgi:predicted dehydrogenase